MYTQIFIIASLCGLVLGAALYAWIRFYLPKKLQKSNLSKKSKILDQRKGQIENLVENQNLRSKEIIKRAHEDFEDFKEAFEEESSDKELKIEESNKFHNQLRSRSDKRLHEAQVKRDKMTSYGDKLQKKTSELQSLRLEYSGELSKKADIDGEKLKAKKQDEIFTSEQLASRKWLKVLEDEAGVQAKRNANRLLYRIESRYRPTFSWPKPSSNVALESGAWLDSLTSINSYVFELMSELCDQVNISLVEADSEEGKPHIKIVGGFGIHKETAKLVFEEVLKRKKPYRIGENELKQSFKKNLENLEKTALSLGKKAIKNLQISSMDPEILKMVGRLNWRTSYRQNQYYHTFEVATLAGMIAREVGVDPEEAKRVGLLHDIGKSIDYRIEGSHAVISGDYADRFGEKRVICDTVMSHHDDLIIETPLAYVLKAADTLSGARPGARVNLEEGYQTRLSSIFDVAKREKGVLNVFIMNGAREVHVEVCPKQIHQGQLAKMSANIARGIEEEVAFPGQIKVVVSRRFEASAVA